MATHRGIATTALGAVEDISIPTESPETGEVQIKNEYGAMIAFDTYQVDAGYFIQGYPYVLGFSSAGTVSKLGEGVDDLKVGDRVTVFTMGLSKNKALQEYTVITRGLVAKIPDSLALDAAATIPDNFVTAFWTVFGNLKLPMPESFPAPTPPPLADEPILVYGAGASSANYMVQLLKLAGYNNVFAIASARHHAQLRAIGAAHTFDYADAELVPKLLAAAKRDAFKIVVDVIAADPSLAAVAKVTGSGSRFAVLLPFKEGDKVTNVGSQMTMEVPQSVKDKLQGVEIIPVATFTYQSNAELRDNLMPKILPQLLSIGAIQPNRVRLMNEGTFLQRVEQGLDLLRNNKISGEKVVVEIKVG